MESEGVLVRRAQTADLTQIANIHGRNKRATIAALKKSLKLHECIVAESKGRIMGYGCMNYAFFGRGFVSILYVAKAARRRGTGNRLLAAFEAECRSERIFTSTNLSNLPMQSLLNSRSYRLSGVVQDLDPGDPELFYSKQLR